MSSTEIERRITFSDTTVEFRDGDGGEKRPVIVGYAAVFNSESRNLGGFVETIHPTAFDNVLAAKPDVIGVYNHDRNKLLARTSNGSMTLKTDPHGLRYEMSLPNTETAREVAELVKEGLVTGSSFAFAVDKNSGDTWSSDPRGIRKREIRSVSLLEDVGPVVRPAYGASSVVVSRRCIELALGDTHRPPQTMANAAKRGLKLAEKHNLADKMLISIAERSAAREVLSVEEVEYLAAAHKRCGEQRASGWSGTPAWIEFQLAGGETGLKWTQRRAATEADSPAPPSESRAAEIGLRPTAGMAAAAKRGIALHEAGRSGDGLKPETVARAKRIAAREELTPDHVREMRAWFRRHKVDKRPGWSARGAETPGYTAWMLWGSDAAWRWSESKVSQMERAAAKRDLPADGDAVEEGYPAGLSPRDLATAESYEAIAEEMGPWPQQSAHYVADNPFAAAGIKCANCVFFEGEGRCYVVAGEIAPDAVCKLWIIPEGAMSENNKQAGGEKQQEPQSEPATRQHDESMAAKLKLAELQAALLQTRLHGDNAAQ